MRELKFRVWDKPHNRLSRPFYVWQDLIEWDNDVPMPIQFTRKEGRFVWLQYTGLKDRNNKEVYEQAIMGTPNGNFVGIVRYSKDMGAYVLSVEGETRLLLGNNHHRLEVIGNVYQNPELLEAEGVEE